MHQFTCTLLVVGTLGVEAYGTPPDVAAIRRELEGVWSRTESKFHAGQWEVEDKRYVPGPKQTLLSHTVKHIRKNNANLRAETRSIFTAPDSTKRGGEGSADAVEMINSRYYCRLSRPAGTADWLIAGDTILRDDPSTAVEFARIAAAISRPQAVSHLTLGGLTPVHEMLGDALFSLKALGPSPSNPGCSRLDYVTKTAAPQGIVTTGWMDLDPAAGWTVREHSLVTTAGQTVITSTHHFTVRGGDTGVPELVAEKSTIKRTTGGVDRGYIDRYVTYQFTPAVDSPEREFTLSAYGLPEPVGIVWDRPTPRWVWLLAGAAGLALVAVLFRFLARRNRDHRPTVPTGTTP